MSYSIAVYAVNWWATLIFPNAVSPVCELVASALNYAIVQVEVFCNNTENVMVTIPTLGVTSSSITLSSGTGPYGEGMFHLAMDLCHTYFCVPE